MANYTEQWEGLTGAAVRGKILDALNSLSALAEDTITNVSFNTDPEDSLKVNWSYTKNGRTVNSSFTLAPSSNSTMNIFIGSDIGSSYAEIFSYGTDLYVPYQYEVLDNGSKVGNLTANIKATITNSKNVSKVIDLKSAVKTASGTNRTGTIKINGTDLFEGQNTIIFTFEVNYNGLVSKTAVATVEAINLQLKTELSGASLDDVYTATTPFTLNFTTSGTTNAVKTIVYYSGYKAITANGNVLTTTFDALRTLASQNYQSASNLDTIGRLRIFIQSYVENNPEVKSNIVMYDLVSTSNNNSTFTGMAFATKLDVVEVTTGDPTISVTQYDAINIPVFCYTTNDAKVKYSLNSNVIGTVDVNAYSVDDEGITNLSYPTNFKEVGTQDFSVYNLDNTDLNLVITVGVKSSGSSIALPEGAKLSLSATGITSATREWAFENYSATFTNFDWSGNGWKDGALVLNNGATVLINYPACTTYAYTASFKFTTANSLEEECMISCMSENTGFEIYPEKAVMYNGGKAITTEFNSGNVHEITFVSYGSDFLKLMCIYIDGSIQCVLEKDNLLKHSNDTFITLKAVKGQLKVYDINCYKRGLSFTEIQSLYDLHKSDSKEIIDYINANNIFDRDTTNLGEYSDAVKISKLPVGSRYLVLESYGEEDPTPWKVINGYLTDDPETYKGIRHLLGSIKHIVKTADGSAHPANFYAERATLSAQGTSSMAYPTKNFRIYFKKAIDKSSPYYNDTEFYTSDEKKGDFGFTTNFWTNVSPNFTPDAAASEGEKQSKAAYALFKKSYGDDVTRDSATANLFCLKADFAESSGSHNTGFARMANYALVNSENICTDREKSQLIPQLYVLANVSEPITKTDIRTTIDGRPIYLFVKRYDEDEPEYYGKYNMNNEKASVDVFGFEGAADYYSDRALEIDPTYAKITKEAANLANLFNDTEGYFATAHPTYSIDESGKYNNKGKDYINPNECWEFSNNTFKLLNAPGEYTGLGAFQYPYTPNNQYPLYNQYPNYNPFTAKGENGKLAWLDLAWEYRWPNLETKAGEEDEGHLNYVNGLAKPYLLESIYKWLYKHNCTLWTGTNKAKMVNEFAQDLHKYFNINFLLKYFILTKWYGNTDLRIKNSMLSIYFDPTASNNTDPEYPMGHMRAYFIFYDNDTILGVDNTGALSNAWNIKEDKYPGYGTHGIWDNLQYCYDYYIQGNKTYIEIYNLGKLIEKAYQALRKVIDDKAITKFFETDLVNKYSDAFFNIDAEIKYFHPNKHLDLLAGAEPVYEPNRVSNIQGNRKFHRAKWLGKRTTWLDSMFEGGNISNYAYAFKTQGVAAAGDGGSVKVTAALDDWRFYMYSASTPLAASPLLKAGDTTTLSSGTISVSDFVWIEGLYGASALDWTDFTVNSNILDLSSMGPLPYLTKFTINNYTSGVHKYMSASTSILSLKLVNNRLMPNLKELYAANIKINPEYDPSSTSHGVLDLSDMAKLEVVDLRGTPVDVTLPNSAVLQEIYLENPSTLNVTNKPNLETLSLVTTDNLLNITVGENNSNAVNLQLITLCNNKLTETRDFLININYGSNYSINNNELNILELIADKVNAGIATKVTVRGNIYNPNISIDLQGKLRRAFGNGLVISTTTSGVFNLTMSTTSLREGESITIYSNKVLASADSWNWSVGNNTIGYSNNSNLGLLTIEKDITSITFTANPSASNNNATYYLTVNAVSEEDTATTGQIPVLYIAVTSLKISANNTILGNGDITDIQILCSPGNHTKQVLLESSASYNTVNGIYSNGLYIHQSTENGSILVTALGLSSNTLEITYDMVLGELDNKAITQSTQATNKFGAKSKDELSWIYQVLFAAKGSEGIGAIRLIKISTLKAINLALYMSSILNTVNDIEMEYDFEYMKYFNYTNTSFSLPFLSFNNLSVPEVTDLTTITWNLSNPTYLKYKKIQFNSAATYININISSLNWLESLKLDFSRCVNITKIYNGKGSSESGLASINITYTALDHNTIGELLIYPPNLEILGNMNFDSNGKPADSVDYPATMFNLISPNGSVISNTDDNKYHAIYSIGDTGKNIKLGAIYGYPVDLTTNVMLLPVSNITDTYYTFYNMNVLPDRYTDGLNFSSIQTVGSGTFYSAGATKIANVTLSSQVSYIGRGAFQSFKGGIYSAVSSDGVLLFDNVERVGNYAFAYLVLSLKVLFDSNKLALGGISSNAFALTDTATSYHTIKITGNSPFAYTADSFGTGKKNSLYITSALNDVMLQAVETYTNLLKNVKLYVDNIQVNA